MAKFLSDAVRDDGLQYITDNVDYVFICTQAPTTYTEATSTYALGGYALGGAAVTVGSPEDNVSDGRRVVVPAVTGGTVTVTGIANHIALVKTATSELIAVTPLAADMSVVNAGTFALDAWYIITGDTVS